MIAGYDIADFLAWDTAAWDRLLSSYHVTIWPAQIVAMLLFVTTLAYWVKSPSRHAHTPALLMLTACWAWVGTSFHAQFHSQLNWAAHYWVTACLTQSLCLVVFALIPAKRRLALNLGRQWLVCLALSVCLPVLIGLAWGRSVWALSWPLLSPDSLAWITTFTLVAWAAITQRQWLAWSATLIPVCLLVVDGLIAYSLPAVDRVVIVSIALVSTLIGYVIVAVSVYRARVN